MQQLTIWLNRLVKLMLCFLFLIIIKADGQGVEKISLEQAYAWAIQNYPEIKQKDLINQTLNLNVKNLETNFLPQFSFNGQGTYQSAVTTIDVPVPGFTFQPLDKDQYKFTADANQLIFDGGAVKQQKNIQQFNAVSEQQKVEVDLYQVKNRINQLYLNVLFQDEQLKQNAISLNDIETGIKKIQAQVENGTVLRSNLQVLQAQQLQTQQRSIEIKNARKSLIASLSILVNKQLADDVQLELPLAEIKSDTTITRPELQLFTAQSNQLEAQKNLISANNLPKASLFVQGGYGRPGYNFLKNEFVWFYMAGVKLNWAFSGLYTQRRSKELINVNKRTVDIQKETFLLNTRTDLSQQQSDIERLTELAESDKAIIDLREKVTEASKAQLENGVITANDYLREINAEDQAKQLLIIHQIQLLQAKLNYQTTLGKL